MTKPIVLFPTIDGPIGHSIIIGTTCAGMSSPTFNPLKDASPVDAEAVLEFLVTCADQAPGDALQAKALEVLRSVLVNGSTMQEVVEAFKAVPELNEWAERLGAFTIPGLVLSA